MKSILTTSLILALCSTGISEVRQLPPLQVTDRQVEMAEGKILKIYSTEQNGAHFYSYVVDWNDSEIIVSDPWHITKKKEGELLEFIVSKIDFNRAGEETKVMHFMVMEKHKMIELTSPPAPDEAKELEELRAKVKAKMKENEKRVQKMKERSNQSH